MTDRAILRLKPGGDRRLLTGHPWIYSNEIEMTQAAKALEAGCVVTLQRADGKPLGTAFFNPKPLISARLLSRNPSAVIDTAFLRDRLKRALALRDRLIGVPHYRLAHAEADGLPGAVIDRYGDTIVIHAAGAGMERLAEPLAEALDDVVRPRAILMRGDGPAREMEGLPAYSRLLKGEIGGPVPVIEHQARFLADPREGQKTGWFFDQRDNRALVARFAAGRRVLDLYSYMGGFSLQSALAGAQSVLAVDRSDLALRIAAEAAAQNDVADRFSTERAEVFDFLEATATAPAYDVVVADPPAFVKSKKDFNQGARAYRKLARLAAARVAPGGILFIASCSHNMPADEFGRQVARGLNDAHRQGRILFQTFAAPDHPVHPALPESAYLKALTLQLD
ncbi:class I SAM-dependent rRNA methyltransferase [Dongia soli]|uniref:Class I SAM-dependent rRNA methyltransferase n=1 Tax=Dongia soli TaxID=600628 RepID=A0ABU5E5R4_9PROT|nr:class I SAM-dependent rRNA methyltransferase [Dongia soli]MDY0881650.1 class I SAM-dependent rRNA methyltransferase [Dongia soli]